jgi:hypothetical protein
MAPDVTTAWKAELAQHSRAFEALWNGLTDEQRRWKQAPDVWSVAECIDHVRSTNAAYRPNLARAIEAAKRSGSSGEPYRPGRIARWFHAQMDPDRSKRKLRAPGVFRPSMHPSDPAILQRFLGEQGEIERLLDAAQVVNLNRGKLFSPVTKLLQLSIGEAFETLVLHERRHLRQARSVLEKPGFPQKKLTDRRPSKLPDASVGDPTAADPLQAES